MPRTERSAPGILLLVGLYLVQAVLDVSWGPLDRWQQRELWRRLTGAVLAGLVVGQVWLAWQRCTALAERSRALLRRHRALGVVALGALFVHTTGPGHGYLLVLGLLIPLQVALGALRPAETSARDLEHRAWWRRLHGGVGAMLLAGLGLHVWIVFAWS